MRYREGQAANTDYAYTENMHHVLTGTMGLSVVIGIVLLALGIRGRVLWLKSWSVGLIVSALLYLVGDARGLF